MANVDEDYSIVPIDNEEDARRCAEFLADEFARNNPLSSFMQTSTASLLDDWLWPVMIDSLDEKLSFMVRRRQNNEVIAALLANDLFHHCRKHPFDPSKLPSNDPVTDFFDDLLHRFVEDEFGQPLRENLVLNLIAGATKASYAGQGIAMKLGKHICHHARDQRGFRYALSQTAHPATRNIYVKKMNGKVTGSVHPGAWFLERSHLCDESCPMKNYRDGSIDNVLIQLEKIDSK